MFKVHTCYLNEDDEQQQYEHDFEDYNEAVTRYAYEVVANDSYITGTNVVARGFDYIEVSLWEMGENKNERLAYWTKAFFLE